MDAAQYSSYCHEAIHQLMRLNEECAQAFKVPSWPRYEYDLDQGTLTFSEEGSPKVIASIHAVGTTSKSSGTWLWGWANESLPHNVTNAVAKVRDFGETENLAELTQSSSPDDEYLGWKLTAIAAKLLGSKGAYRCPSESGFIYFVYSSLRFAGEGPATDSEAARIECATHGNGFQTFVCEHLASNPSQEWFSDEPSDSNQWPDAWCATCEGFFEQEGEWNDKNESKLKIKLLCHHCYEKFRALERSGI